MAGSLAEFGYPIGAAAARDPSQVGAKDQGVADEVERAKLRPGLAPAQGVAVAVAAGALLWAGAIATFRALFF